MMEAAQEIDIVCSFKGLSTRSQSHCGFVVLWIDCPLLGLMCVGSNPGIIRKKMYIQDYPHVRCETCDFIVY